ncbi:response regulator transcription factor [Emticicia agri]|uniref:response regulator transcription factor n=1 Tax=Emticicia agri TaxID=2492393 RepID=UPI0013ED58A8|nr:helix-turn-helix transcriptional regulator [Emticicia agri]
MLRIQETINKHYPNQVEIDYEKYLEQTGVFSLFNQNQGAMSIIFDIKRCKIVNISKNITTFAGYNRKEFGENLTLSLISLLTPEHISLISVFATWIQKVLKHLPKTFRVEHFLNCWGVKLYHKSGETMKCHLSVLPLESDTEGKPLLFFISIQNITHLMKGDDYWIRGVFGKDEKKIFVYHSNEDKTVEQEILSEREKEVLKYIIQGLNTKQIAEILDISPNTVDNHRRNMLARTGTRDTTALIHLCKMMAIV